MSKLILLVISLTVFSAMLVNCRPGVVHNKARRQIQCTFTDDAINDCIFPLGMAALRINTGNCEDELVDTLNSCLPRSTCTGNMECAIRCVVAEVCVAPLSIAANPTDALDEAIKSAESCLKECTEPPEEEGGEEE